MRRASWITLCACSAVVIVQPGLSAQTGSIAGRVTDDSGSPLQRAEVLIASLGLTVLTLADGAYVLTDVPVGNHSLVARHAGHLEMRAEAGVGAGQAATVDFRLRVDRLGLGEPIVAGTPLSTPRRAIGSSVTTVNVPDVVGAMPATSLQDVLTGRVPGIRYTRLTGIVGTGSPFTLRGVGSFAAARTRPLVYVDGIRVYADPGVGPNIGSGRSASALDDLGLEEIERVEILHGPAATSLYGTDAASGVVQIATKRGREGPLEFTMSIREGDNFLADPAGRLGTFYFCPTQPSPSPTTGVACRTADALEPFNMYDEANAYLALGYGKGDGWLSDRVYSNGPSRSYDLQARGGAGAIRYFLSTSYDDETGYVFYNDDETLRARANVGVELNDHFNVDLTTALVEGATTFAAPTISRGGEWQDLSWSNGYYLDRNNPFGTTGRCVGLGCAPNPRLGGFQAHLPSDLAEDVEVTRDYQRVTGSVAIDFTSGDLHVRGMTGSLTSRLLMGIDRGWDVNRNWFRRENGAVPSWLGAYCGDGERLSAVPSAPATCPVSIWTTVYGETAQGEMTYERPVHSDVTIDWTLASRLRPSARWSFATSIGAQYYARSLENFANTGQGFSSFQSTTINQVVQANIRTTYELDETKSAGAYVQEEVEFEGRVFLTGSLRVDDHSSFGPDAGTQSYPRVSASWIVSDESFWSVPWADVLRLRAAWGRAGRAPGNTSALTLFVPATGQSGGTAVRPSSLGNPQVGPEVSTELEFGLDFALLEHRVTGQLTRYSRRSDGLLLDVPSLSSSGFGGTMERNLGRIDSWGWEAQLYAHLYDNDRFALDLDFGADHSDNEIVDLCGDASGVDVCFPGSTSIRIGYPYPNRTVPDLVVGAGFDAALPSCNSGLYAAGTRCRFGQNGFGESLYAYCDQGATAAPGGITDPRAGRYARFPGGTVGQCGDAAFADQNLYAGRGFATHAFTVSPRVTLLDGDLEVFALAEGQYGRVGEDGTHLWGHNYRNSAVARLQDDAWWVAQDLAVGFGCAWDKCLYDADFWKLREVGARYSVPAGLVGRIGAERASLGLSARNVYTIWQAQKRIAGHVVSDPELGNPNQLGGGGNPYEQPPLSSVSVTLRVTF